MTAKIELAFRPGVITEIEIEDQNLLFYAGQSKAAVEDSQEHLVLSALNSPISSPRLKEIIKPDDNILIIIDDFTRPTPTAVILPEILKQVHVAGVSRSEVKILVAAGTHRPMSDDELAIKLGKEIHGKYQVFNHDYLAGPFVDLGHTKSGIPVEVNELVTKADIRLAVGNVVPHTSAGWGGGSKIILPGVCSYKTTEMMHIRAVLNQPLLDVPGKRNTQTRHEMDDIAAKVGLDFIVNTVLDDGGNILKVFAGHFVEAHKEACIFAEKMQIIPIPALADILIVSANPCHFDFWQGLKPYIYGHLGVRKDGIIIFLLDGTEGLCGDAPTHEETFRNYLLWSFEDQKSAVECGEVEDLIGIHATIQHAQVRNRVKKTICVSRNITPEDMKVLGFESASSVQEALEMAYEILGRGAKVGVIPYGGETLVKPVSSDKQ
ncbi:MAG: nickel-dependent lactate racemase [Anaerolineales bacterium]